MTTRAPELNAQFERCCRGLLGLLQALSQEGVKSTPRLWLVTAGAQSVKADEPLDGLPQATIWGLGKVIAQEFPELSCVRIDLESIRDIEPLLNELTQSGEEPLIAYRGGRRHVARLSRLQHSAAQQPFEALLAAPVQLAIVERGTSAGVALVPAARVSPGSEEVEIEVRAAGLNFRDVLNVLGVRQDQTPLGGEVAGIITALGAGVEGLKVGEEVLAITSGGIGNFCLAPAELTLPKPANLDFEAAAASPLAFLTAHYALNVIGRMAKGERVLIHAAAGGVGMAAVQLAQRAGLEIFATAGSAAKREFLQSLGIAHVFDSRSLEFADAVRTATHAEGVDLVLNSLTGPAIGASLALLRSKGRFLEIGKAEIWTAARGADINPRAQYLVIDLAELIARDPKSVRPLFVDLLARLARGELRPLPSKTFPFTAAAQAIEHMARAKHIGKVVLAATTREAAQREVSILADATYLISGGLTGLGLACAQWLIERGARNLLLFGRHAPSAETAEVLETMRARGARIVAAQSDVACEADVSRLFDGPLRALPPVRGVIHSAGVLDDGILMQQRWANFAQVLAPKATGAWVLHQKTAHCALDFFVLFSSASALLGAPGQANHAAANAFLDALAHYRRAQGLPGLSINWGAWAQIGAAAQRHVGARILKQGIGELTAAEGLQALQRALKGGEAQVGVIRADWSQLNETLENAAERRFFAHLGSPRASTQSVERSAKSTAARELRDAPADKRITLLLQHVRAQVSAVIGLPSGQPMSDKQPLRDMGMDSLMAIELRNRLRMELSIEQALPATLVFDHPTIDALAAFLASEVYGWTTRADARTAVRHADALDLIEQLSDDDVEKLYSERSGGSVLN
jgi:NADPH:quinone reductase-like Zn-dependent oxidoreductase/aryl carrier-like protein